MIRFHGVEVDIRKIKEAINIILQSNIHYEFRTTVYPKYIGKENVENIAKYLKNVGCKRYILQNYFDLNHQIKAYSKEQLEEMKRSCSQYLPTEIRGMI